ncbi:MAG: transketolase C-terminal domain-containing protein [Patescibacteria group bacterium]
MINPKAHLVENISDASKLEHQPTRDGYGRGVVVVGERDERIVVITADLVESTRSHWFAEKFPERFIEVGVAEQNLAVVAAGMAVYGKIPFIASYATFSPGRNNEQIRTNIAINNVPVKIVGCHAGVSVGPDGATHQALEDLALMRVIPRMVVVSPCDAVEAEKATIALAFNNKPSYLRIAREKSPVFTTDETPFEIGKAEIFREGKDAAIIGCGPLVYNALKAAEELSKEGIECEVVNCHTIKPIDEETIVKVAQNTGAVVSVEEHQIAGGLGSAIAEVLSRRHPTPQEFIGMQDRFGESGSPSELIEHFGMGVSNIKDAVRVAISRKK